MYFGENCIYGIKTIIDLIAVAAVMNATKNPDENPSILSTFVKFLDDVCNIDKLKLAFEKDFEGNYWVIQNSGGKS